MTPRLDRRDFLQRTGMVGAVAALGWWNPGRGVSGVFAADTAEPALIARTETPYNAEPPLSTLTEHWLTPLERFFIRSHGNVPAIKPEEFRLSISGMVEHPQSFTLAQLIERFPRTSTVATMTCAGNRRSEFAAVKKAPGVQWEAGAIGNAVWSGIRLADVLRAVGVTPEAKHVWFEGLDTVTDKNESFPFGGSVPLDKAFGDPPVLLATHMQKEPLRPEHGYPIRAVVPGFIGARSVKWLSKILVSDQPSTNHFQADTYKILPEDQPGRLAITPPIHEHILNSAITSVKAGTALPAGRTTVRGYALAGGVVDRTVTHVEVSVDDGKSWTLAKFDEPARPLCWVFWSADVTVTNDTRELLVRAVDSSGSTQPREMQWNVKGYQLNSWHRVPLKRGS